MSGLVQKIECTIISEARAATQILDRTRVALEAGQVRSKIPPMIQLMNIAGVVARSNSVTLTP